jgi:hypothetical protein
MLYMKRGNHSPAVSNEIVKRPSEICIVPLKKSHLFRSFPIQISRDAAAVVPTQLLLHTSYDDLGCSA